MRRTAVTLLLILALPMQAAPEKWWEAYNRGVKAVNAKQYDVAASALQKAIAEMPGETTAARTSRDIITYVPHFWLGIAKFHLNDMDGALREWKISDEQGAIAKTDYYSRMRDFISRAQSEKVRSAQTAASGAKNAADASLSRALSGQMEALAAGADRTDTYRVAERKLKDAWAQFNSAGADIRMYERAESGASQARELFARATEDAKRHKAARPAVVAKNPTPTPQPVVTAPVAPVPQPPAPQPVVAAALTETAAPPPVTDTAESKAAPLLATDSTERKAPLVVQVVPHQTPPVQPPPPPTAMIGLSVPPTTNRDLLQFAYRAYATGDLDLSERTLSSMVTTSPSGEVYLLRGCARYARAVLSRNEALLNAATNDFKAALRLNRSLRLDRKTFSPKMIAFFEQVRKAV